MEYFSVLAHEGNSYGFFSFRGVQQVITDYVHGPTLPKLVHSAWAGVSVLTLIGLAYFNYADVGICKAVAALWAL